MVTHVDRRQGEDWAEKMVARVVDLIGVPAAGIELAQRREGDEVREGCISCDVRPDGWESHTGAVLLGEIVQDFAVRSADRRGHTLRNIAAVLQGYGAAPSFQGPAHFTGFDVFVGFLMLDALVANQDRHSENWSVILGPDRERALMASYDHASSLGFGETDQRRHLLLTTDEGIARWVRKGTAQRFESGSRTTLVELAHVGFDMVEEGVRSHWLGKLQSVTTAQLWTSVADVDRMSRPERRFCYEVMVANRERMLQ